MLFKPLSNILSISSPRCVVVAAFADGAGKTALAYAIEGGRKKLAEWFLRRAGADAVLLKPHRDGSSLILLAARNGWADMVRFMLVQQLCEYLFVGLFFSPDIPVI